MERYTDFTERYCLYTKENMPIAIRYHLDGTKEEQCLEKENCTQENCRHCNVYQRH